ncbi:Arginine decarboxylase [Forsythia ovata]|uniref:Arginine decarboxylase n=1 Tax=Forsythia ovata TaxID=205694 RepID=A0ABD1V100_9LAMI
MPNVYLALVARKLHLNIVIVLEQEEELDIVIDISRKLGVRPVIGVRAKHRTKHSGHFGSTSGEKGKFGLTTTQILRIVKRLEQYEMLDCLQLLHFEAVSTSSYQSSPMSFHGLQNLVERLPNDALADYRNLSHAAIRGDNDTCLLCVEQFKQRWCVCRCNGPYSFAVTHTAPSPPCGDVLQMMQFESHLMFETLKHRAEELANNDDDNLNGSIALASGQQTGEEKSPGCSCEGEGGGGGAHITLCYSVMLISYLALGPSSDAIKSTLQTVAEAKPSGCAEYSCCLDGAESKMGEIVYNTAAEMWGSLKRTCLSSTATISVVDKLAAIGQPVFCLDQISSLLHGLGSEYNAFVTSINNRPDEPTIE